MRQTYHIYTDGGCEPNPGTGGWGFIILDDERNEVLRASGGEPNTTNNRMEISAAVEGVKAVLNLNKFTKEDKVIVYSDSKYVVNSINIWLANWVARNETKKNMDLWLEFYKLSRLVYISAEWVPGHSGIEYNEIADKLATEGRELVRSGIKFENVDIKIIDLIEAFPHLIFKAAFNSGRYYLTTHVESINDIKNIQK